MVRLETARLILRDHEPGDLEPYCEMESDPVFRAHQPVHPREELERTGLYPHRTEGGVIVPREATLAFYIARAYWGRGIATEAGQAFVEHGFRDLGLVKIHAGVNAANLASVRVIEKLGFRWVRSGGDHVTQ